MGNACFGRQQRQQPQEHGPHESHGASSSEGGEGDLRREEGNSHPATQPPNISADRPAPSQLTGQPESGGSGRAFYILRKTEAVADVYEVAEELGSGQFGVVHVGINKRTRKRFAIKSISKRKAEASTSRFCKDIRNEVEIMFHLSGHSNIIQLYEVYEDADAIHLILELCEGGDWFERLLQNGTYSECHAAETARTLLQTIAYCHSLGVVHRDIKPENLLFSDSSSNSSIKLADFGLSVLVPKAALEAAESQDVKGGAAGPLHEGVGSSFYVAPEVLKGRGYGKECDVWSLGVVFFIALGGYPPFEGSNDDEIFEATMYKPLRFSNPTWNEISPEGKDMVTRMLCKDPRRRATISELLAHPWLAKMLGSGIAVESSPVPDTVVARLRNFAAMNRFKKEARRVLATLLPEEEVMGLRNIFLELDTNRDGVVTLAELNEAFKSKGVSLPDSKIQELMRSADLNGDSVIDYEEFLGATVHQMRLDKDELLYRAFRVFDRDGSGFITEQELLEALTPVSGGQVDIAAILCDIDTDRDGRINYEEFCNCMRIRAEDGGSAALISVPTNRSRPKLALNGSGNRSRSSSRTRSRASSLRNFQSIDRRSVHQSRLARPRSELSEAGAKSGVRFREASSDRTGSMQSPERDEVSGPGHLLALPQRVAAGGQSSRLPLNSSPSRMGRGDALADVLKHISGSSGSGSFQLTPTGSPGRKGALQARRQFNTTRSRSAQTDPIYPSPPADRPSEQQRFRGRYSERDGGQAGPTGGEARTQGKGEPAASPLELPPVSLLSLFPPIQLPNSILSRPGSFASSRRSIQLPPDDGDGDDSGSAKDQTSSGPRSRSRPVSGNSARSRCSRSASRCGSSLLGSRASSRAPSQAGSCKSIGGRSISRLDESPLSREASKHSMSRMAMAAGLPSPHPSLLPGG